MLCETCVQLFARIARAVRAVADDVRLHVCCVSHFTQSKVYTFKSIKHLLKIQSIGKPSKVFVVLDCYDATTYRKSAFACRRNAASWKAAKRVLWYGAALLYMVENL